MTSTTTPRTTVMTATQKAAGAVGAVFLLVGILGFVPGITSNFDSIGFIGHESEAALLGLFQVNILHNLVHLLFGVAGLAAAKASWGASRSFLLYGGVIYLVLFVYGFVIDLGSPLNFVSLNTADNWLHLVLGAGMVLLGVVLPKSDRV
jgi:hypothetical protein